MVDVLDTRVGQEMNVGALDERECLLNNRCGGLPHDLVRKLPGEDLPREVVHDGVQVDLGAVEKTDDDDVQMPPLVWSTARIPTAGRRG